MDELERRIKVYPTYGNLSYLDFGLVQLANTFDYKKNQYKLSPHKWLGMHVYAWTWLLGMSCIVGE